MFVHLDCNNFFVSCELVSRPELKGTPVVVANNNDNNGGIILALNQEAKAVGLKRGNPIFQVTKIIEQNKVTVIDVHHQLYHDISHQIMDKVRETEMVLDFVQYSVDEFFGMMPDDDPVRLREYLQRLKDLILRETDIPVSCGAGLSYTLGGIGRRSFKRLAELGIQTALDYANQKEAWVKRLFGVNGVRTWKELNGVPAITIAGHDRQKSIMYSRTFAHMTSSKEVLMRELSNYASSAARRMREQQSLCQTVTLFLATNRHRQDLAQYSADETLRLSAATDDSTLIIKAVEKLLETLFRENYQYKQAGVILGQLQSNKGVQLDLFAINDLDEKERHKRLMKAIDGINHRFGKNHIHFAIQGSEADFSDQPAGFMRPKKVDS